MRNGMEPTKSQERPDESPATRSPARPHMVWFICDQLRADALGFMGNDIVQTPNLDRLAGQGVVFDNMYVQSPVCMPNRGCMITGKYLRNIGMANGSPLLHPRETTMPELLQKEGYRTGMFGKLHLTPQQYTAETLKSDRPISDARVFLAAAGLPPMPDDPFKRNYGFQEVVGYEDILKGEYIDWLAGRDAGLAARMTGDGEGVFHPDFPEGPLKDVGTTDVPPALHPSMFIGESAAEFFERNHRQAPCFMEVSFVDPHHPWDPPAALAAHYLPDEIPLPRYSDPGSVAWPPSLAARAYDFSTATPEMTRTTIAYYYAMIEMIDMAVGRVIEAIERAGQLDNTIFVFVADHGELLGDCGLFRKGSYHYDCMIRTPCFISAPGMLSGGRRIGGLVQAIDLAPTLLGLTGQPVYAGMQGQDLSEELLQGTDIGREWTYTEMYTAWWGPFVACWTLRTETAKLNFYPDDQVGHLFDLTEDPHERVDLWACPEHRSLRDQMMAMMLEDLCRQADPLPKVLSQF